MKDFPRYTSIKYYYSDKTTSNTFLFGESANKNGIYGNLIGSLVLTEDGVIYLNLHQGTILTPDSYRDDRCIPMEWVTQRAIKYAIDYQPYDFDDTWLRGYSMYSKDFWNFTYQDIRDFKIKISLNEYQPTGECDGDGSLSMRDNKIRVSLISTKECLQEIQDILSEINISKTKISEHYGQYRIHLYKDALNFLKFVYDEKLSYIYLSRKYNKFINYENSKR